MQYSEVAKRSPAGSLRWFLGTIPLPLQFCGGTKVYKEKKKKYFVEYWHYEWSLLLILLRSERITLVRAKSDRKSMTCTQRGLLSACLFCLPVFLLLPLYISFVLPFFLSLLSVSSPRLSLLFLPRFNNSTFNYPFLPRLLIQSSSVQKLP